HFISMNKSGSSVAFFEGGYYKEKPGGLAYRRSLAHYLNLVIPGSADLLEIGCGSGQLLGLLKSRSKTGIDASASQISEAEKNCPGAVFICGDACEVNPDAAFDVVLVSDTLNHCSDAQALLEAARRFARPEARLVITTYNTLWRPALSFLTSLGLRSPQPDLNWLSGNDVRNIAELAGWEIIKSDGRILLPVQLSFLSAFVNRWVAPFLPVFCLANIMVARRAEKMAGSPSVSIVIPARNEAGNIPAAIERIPAMAPDIEYIFIEGHSTDSTWEAIVKVQAAHPNKKIKIARQTGKGKGDAVRLGFSMAEGDILMILDADLTMPPEDLPKFYRALADGRCEFANGCRLIYPMEKEAMQFLNLCANKLFGVLFSWILGQNLKDTLCGTKVLSRKNYEAIARNRAYFGDFDPFGDFDLLFGADKLNLKIRDIPVRYRERTYGSTNISRFRHGILLFRMVAFAAKKLKFV
ncbi:MAG: glycosyltransferase, partial [Verrucomicrobiota bacterium]